MVCDVVEESVLKISNLRHNFFLLSGRTGSVQRASVWPIAAASVTYTWTVTDVLTLEEGVKKHFEAVLLSEVENQTLARSLELS